MKKNNISKQLQRHLSTFEIIEKGPNFFRATAKIKPDSPVFQGHFPQKPVLPGAFHIWFTYLILSAFLNEDLFILKVANAKFKKILQPDDEIKISCKFEIKSDNQLVANFTIEKDNKNASKFTIHMRKQQNLIPSSNANLPG